MTYFTADFFKHNRRRLLAELQTTAPIIVTANGVMQRNSDVTYPFRQDSSFWYLTGVDKPDIVLVIDGANEYLILPERDEVVRQFDGDDDRETLARVSSIPEILYDQEGWEKLAQRLKETKQVTTLLPPPAFVERHSIYTNPARSRLLERLKAQHDGIDVQDARQVLATMRAVKQPEELAALQTAIDLTGTALDYVYKNRLQYAYEYEIEADITRVFRGAGYGHAFAPIVASGKSACTIHHVANDNRVEANGLLVLDIGAEVSHYAADITRTFALGETTKRQQAVYDAVRDVQQFALSELKAGVFMKEYEKKVERYMGEKLQELGLIKDNDKASIRRYYPHATSHFLGLDTHDVGDYEQPLAPGMVITCEPGIYIPAEGIGVRIEDDVLLTKDGARILSEKLPARL